MILYLFGSPTPVVELILLASILFLVSSLYFSYKFDPEVAESNGSEPDEELNQQATVVQGSEDEC